MIQQGLTTSFKEQMLQTQQNLLTDTLYMALYSAAANLGPTTTAYTATSEVSGTGYVAGGVQVTGATIASDSNGVVYVDFNNVSWPGANFTARGALLYNVTNANAAIAVLDFGSDKLFTAATNTVTMPVNSASTALIRFP